MAAQNVLQAQYSILDLVAGVQPTGAEVAEFIQNGVSVKLSIAQIIAAAGLPVPTIRQPAFNATISILTSDIEVGVSTATSAVTINLPSALAWSTALPGGATGLDLVIVDRTGNAAAHPMTFALNGADTFMQGALPVMSVAFGGLRIRPFGVPVSGWFVKEFG